VTGSRKVPICAVRTTCAVTWPGVFWTREFSAVALLGLMIIVIVSDMEVCGPRGYVFVSWPCSGRLWKRFIVPFVNSTLMLVMVSVNP
jgi:hypothetical protein